MNSITSCPHNHFECFRCASDRMERELTVARAERDLLRANLAECRELLATAADHLEMSIDALASEDQEAAEDERCFIAECRSALASDDAKGGG